MQNGWIHPIIILNIEGYFDALIKMLHHAVDEHFMRPQHKGIWQVANTPEEAVELLYTTPLWDRSVRRLAAI